MLPSAGFLSSCCACLVTLCADFSECIAFTRTSCHRAAISDAGFSFLLADTYGQLWAVLRQYIADAQVGLQAMCWPATLVPLLLCCCAALLPCSECKASS